jgi:hypothetical protein
VYVVIQRAALMIQTRLVSSVADLDHGTFAEGHPLDDKMAKRVPKKLIGRRLTRTQAADLLIVLDGKDIKARTWRDA